ncbi:hypothetical protein H0H81_000440 [Sphagnurus paluster]|uniref:Uncharacterized protein n=1 Tax=Sphagnurus paluster TaxID=117069 RepID=A0A9P7GNP2_9AGAR|nr:hypothetical protein H0H81_000440 [Sphagnurus paluster]
MSAARQNKKQRKGRNNPNNRERTVTTLTEDPNTPYLVPTPSEEPAGASLMSSPFSVASSSAGNAPSSSAYQAPSSYAAFGFNTTFGTPGTHAPPHTQTQPQQQQQQPFYPQQQQSPLGPPMLPPGRNDLEILENLKQIIKAGQHDKFRAIPQPLALASIYLGTIPNSQNQAPHQPEQAPYGNANDGPSQASPTEAGLSSPVDLGRRPPRLQSKDSWDPSGQRKSVTGPSTSGAQPSNNTNQAAQGQGGRYSQGNILPSAINTSSTLTNGTTRPTSASLSSIDAHVSEAPSTIAGPAMEGPGPISPRTSRFEPNGARLASTNPDQPGTRLGHGESGYRRAGSISHEKGSFDTKDDLRRDSSWSARDVPPSDDRRRELDMPPPSPASRSIVNGNGSSDTRSTTGDRGLPPRDDRYYDRERERERDYRDRRDWDRDRRPPYDRFRGLTDARRPPPEQRHYEPDYDRTPLRRYDVKDVPRRLSDAPASAPVDDRASVRPVDDRLPPSARVPPSPRTTVDASRPPHSDSRAPPIPDSRATLPDNRPVRAPSFEDRHVKPAADERRGVPLPPDERGSISVRAAEVTGANRPADDRSRDVPMTPVEARPQVPLEERLSRPSLQDRLSQPAVTRVEPITRQASLEERLSAIPVSADSREQRGRIPDRVPPARPGPPIDDRARPAPPPPPPAAPAQDDRRGDDRGRYTRGPSPPPGDRATYPPPSVRDDPRAAKGPPSPRHRSIPRDYRPPGRPLSRERPGGSYRPEERSYAPDDRRSDPMDVDHGSRYNDTRPVPYNRPFSPPSAADLARDRARAQFPPSPARPHPPLDAPPYDDDRRYSSRDWPYPPTYSDRRREWSAADEDYYKSRQWDRSGPPPPPITSERERYERERDREPIRGHGGWETREERDRRDFQHRAPSPPGLRVYEPSRPSFPPAAGGVPNDRAYAPPPPQRDPQQPPPQQQQQQPPAIYSRVRQRSISPARRADDVRPPTKRVREDGYPSEFYPPSTAPGTGGGGGPGAPLRRPESTYPHPPLSRGSSPPPTSGASSYFDRSGPPPSSASTVGSVVEREREREREREYPPREYAVQSYERPRSPGRG